MIGGRRNRSASQPIGSAPSTRNAPDAADEEHDDAVARPRTSRGCPAPAPRASRPRARRSDASSSSTTNVAIPPIAQRSRAASSARRRPRGGGRRRRAPARCAAACCASRSASASSTAGRELRGLATTRPRLGGARGLGHRRVPRLQVVRIRVPCSPDLLVDSRCVFERRVVLVAWNIGCAKVWVFGSYGIVPGTGNLHRAELLAAPCRSSPRVGFLPAAFASAAKSGDVPARGLRGGAVVWLALRAWRSRRSCRPWPSRRRGSTSAGWDR